MPGTGTGQALGVVRGEQLAIGPIGPPRDRDSQSVPEPGRNPLLHRLVPPADEHRGNGDDVGVQSLLDPALHPALIRSGGGDVLLGGKEQGDVDRDAGEDRLLDGGESLRRARNLDEDVGPLDLPVQRLDLVQGTPVSCARIGDTSSETQPSRWLVADGPAGRDRRPG